MSQTPETSDLSGDKPLTNFSDCHAGIISHLKTFGELPALVDPAARSRTIAEETLVFFSEAVLDHHKEEEKDLFPSVLANATKGAEHDMVQSMVDQLKAEHRDIEALWRDLEPQVRKVAKGQPAQLDAAAVEHLVHKYIAHARFEEDKLLPLSEKILGRKSSEMAALGLSLHMRHVVRDWRRHGMRGS